MTDRVRYRPFTGDEEVRIRLDAAPLELVLCQIKWPELGALQGDFTPLARQFGAALSDFPLYNATQEMGFEITPAGVSQKPLGTLYQWSSPDRKRSVTLGKSFLTLSSKRYEGYEEFSDQLGAVLAHLNATVNIPIVERVGVRYVNRIIDPSVTSRIHELVRPEILGYQALPTATTDVTLKQALNQALFEVGAGLLQARSGILSPGESLDPSIDVLNIPSWVLDIDSFQQEERIFGIDEVLSQAGRLSDAAYDFFKLVIKDGFIEKFEGRRI